MKFTEISPSLDRNKLLFSNLSKSTTLKKFFNEMNDEEKERLKKEIYHYYFEREWGIKLVARNVLGVTYTICRSLLQLYNFEFRRGTNIVTNPMFKFRKEKAILEKQTNSGWCDPSIVRKTNYCARGIQGYYINEIKKEYRWLRSSWEYIFAKFLNKIGADWDIEVSAYKLSDGTYYRPDFFIYKNKKLKAIVEIKGYFDNHSYKVDLLREEYFKDKDVEIVLIRDIKQFISSDTNLSREIKTWKKIRKSKEFILNE